MSFQHVFTCHFEGMVKVYYPHVSVCVCVHVCATLASHKFSFPLVRVPFPQIVLCGHHETFYLPALHLWRCAVIQSDRQSVCERRETCCFVFFLPLPLCVKYICFKPVRNGYRMQRMVNRFIVYSLFLDSVFSSVFLNSGFPWNLDVCADFSVFQKVLLINYCVLKADMVFSNLFFFFSSDLKTLKFGTYKHTIFSTLLLRVFSHGKRFRLCFEVFEVSLPLKYLSSFQ